MSKKFEIRKTFEEISLAIASSASPIKIFEVVNCLPPRSWKFTIGDGITLRIASEPSLSEKDALVVLSDANEQIFNCKKLKFLCDDGGVLEYSWPLAERSCTVTVSGSNDVDQGTLILEGFGGKRLHNELAKDEMIDAYFQNSTWKGSALLKPAQKRTVISLSRFGQVHNIHAPVRYNVTDSFHKECQIDGERLIVYIVAQNSKRKERIRLFHTFYGIVPNMNDMIGSIERFVEGSVCLDVEFREPDIRVWPDRSIAPWPVFRDSLKKVVSTTEKILQSSEYQGFLEKIEKRNVVKQAEALKQRQQGLETRTKVFVKDKFIGFEPRSENEVMLLLGKLEMLGQLPLAQFVLYEYTPKQGIDALGDLQIDPADALGMAVPIELENFFENFFDHGHPAGQVKMIVCWAMRNSSTRKDYKLQKRRSGLYSCYLAAKHQVYVLVLSELPGLNLKK